MAVTTYVVLADTEVTWGNNTTYVRKGTLVSIDPGNAALVAAYGGGGNLGTLPPGQSGDDADHATIGN